MSRFCLKSQHHRLEQLLIVLEVMVKPQLGDVRPYTTPPNEACSAEGHFDQVRRPKPSVGAITSKWTIRDPCWLHVTFVFAALLLSFASAQESTQQPTTPAESTSAASTADSRATIYVYRHKQFAGSALSPSVYCDETELARMENGRFFVAKLAPGKHVFSSNDKQAGIEVELKPGQQYYIRVELVTGFMKGHGRWFFVSIAFSLIAWGTVTARYIRPKLRLQPRAEALQPLLTLHSFRFIGLGLLVPGVVSPDLPAAFAHAAAYGDIIAAILALLSLLSLPSRTGVVVRWIFNLWGAADLLNALYQAAHSGMLAGQLGAAFFLPTLIVPLLLLTHGLGFRILLQHQKVSAVQQSRYAA